MLKQPLPGISAELVNRLRWLISLNAFTDGWNIGLAIFGLSLLIVGYLVFKSGCLPKFLGILVDVGGYRLHINCTGTGAPSVVIDAGLGDYSTMWAWVQPGVAKTTQVCTYDRAGNGWSEAGLLPRDAEQYAKELHTLPHAANIPGPYVLVGHSLGGFTVRVFTDMVRQKSPVSY
jgi:hypothetical protein